MSKVLRYWIVIGVTLFVLMCQPLAAADTRDGNLVDVRWLQQHLNDPGLLLLDASPGPLYAAQHIAGAVNVDLLTYGVHEIPRQETEERLRSWGVSPGRTIVLYDQGGSMMATRLFFSLYYYGFPAKDLLVLDGGLSKWQASGLPVTRDVPPPPAKGTFTIGSLREDARVRLPEFLNASGDPARNALVEALGADWHFGEVVAFDRGGHPPNGILLPSADFYNADKTFKSADEIRRMLDYVNVRPEQNVYTYCGGGVAASVPFFALKFLLGYPTVKLYSESEMGWLSDDRKLPYWTYDAPYLVRDPAWLQTWGGRRMRMYTAAPISVIDLRSAEAFAEGHVPFSLNLPASTFRENFQEPERLASIMGPAGVDPGHEAVLVSGGGLTPEAALAFLTLERAGQKKVSILLDSMEQWTKLGFALTKDATVIGPKKGLQDLSIPPSAYVARARDGVVIGDPSSTKGLYPKVFLSSGKALPTVVPDGKVVHLPYIDLLDAAGMPKPAKDIWSALSKAGMPRYAEIVCVADDPGEAAANYYLLKLMGFPDVKVLAR